MMSTVTETVTATEFPNAETFSTIRHTSTSESDPWKTKTDLLTLDDMERRMGNMQVKLQRTLTAIKDSKKQIDKIQATLETGSKLRTKGNNKQKMDKKRNSLDEQQALHQSALQERERLEHRIAEQAKLISEKRECLYKENQRSLNPPIPKSSSTCMESTPDDTRHADLNLLTLAPQAMAVTTQDDHEVFVQRKRPTYITSQTEDDLYTKIAETREETREENRQMCHDLRQEFDHSTSRIMERMEQLITIQNTTTRERSRRCDELHVPPENLDPDDEYNPRHSQPPHRNTTPQWTRGTQRENGADRNHPPERDPTPTNDPDPRRDQPPNRNRYPKNDRTPTEQRPTRRERDDDDYDPPPDRSNSPTGDDNRTDDDFQSETSDADRRRNRGKRRDYVPLPALFEGKPGNNPEKFLESMERYFVFKRITADGDKVNALMKQIKPDVTAMIERLPEDERETYPQISRFLKDNYRLKIKPEETRRAFDGRNQQQGESHQDYYHHLRLLHDVGWRSSTRNQSEADLKDSEQKLIDRFIGGIRSSQVRHKLKEAFYPLWHTKGLPADTIAEYADGLLHGAPHSQVYCTMCKNTDHHTRDCSNSKRYIQEVNTPDTQQQAADEREEATSSNHDRNPIVASPRVKSQPVHEEVRGIQSTLNAFESRFKQQDLDKAERLKNQPCFRCWQPGHSYFACPNADKMAQEQARRDERFRVMEEKMDVMMASANQQHRTQQPAAEHPGYKNPGTRPKGF